MDDRVKAFIILGAFTLPFTTIMRWDYKDINEALRNIPLYIFCCLCLCILAFIVRSYSSILGLFLLYAVANTLYYHQSLGLVQLVYLCFGVGLLVVLRDAFRNETFRIVGVVGFLTLFFFELVVAFCQFAKMPIIKYGENYDFVHGTFGHHNFLGSFFAMVAPMMAWWLSPFAVFGLLMSESLLSFIAATGGVIVQIRRNLYRFLFLGACVLAVVFTFWNKSHDSFWARYRIWRAAFVDIDTNFIYLLFGRGLSSWLSARLQDAVDPEQVFWQAHNEYLQLFFELGLVGIGFLAWFLYENRAILRNGSVVALLISCGGIYVFHTPVLAVMAITVAALFLGSEDAKLNQERIG